MPITHLKVKSPAHYLPFEASLRIWPAEAEVYAPQIAIEADGGHYGNARMWVNGEFSGTIHFQNGHVFCGHDLGGKAHWEPYATPEELEQVKVE